MIYEIITNKVVLSVFLSVFIAQLIKSVIHLYKTGKYDWRWLFRDAGMPSAHTATVVSLTLAIYLTEGITNFSIAVAVFSAIVVRDVIGDKIFAEHQEKLINQIIIKIQKSLLGEKVQWKHLIGHTVREVIAGFALAMVITLVVFYKL